MLSFLKAVLCPFVNCSGAVIPDGECCAVCPPTLPPKCAVSSIIEVNGHIYYITSFHLCTLCIDCTFMDDADEILFC